MPGIHVRKPRKKCAKALHLSFGSWLDGLPPLPLLPQIIGDPYKPAVMGVSSKNPSLIPSPRS